MIRLSIALAVLTLAALVNAAFTHAAMRRIKELEAHSEATDEFAQAVTAHVLRTARRP